MKRIILILFLCLLPMAKEEVKIFVNESNDTLSFSLIPSEGSKECKDWKRKKFEKKFIKRIPYGILKDEILNCLGDNAKKIYWVSTVDSEMKIKLDSMIPPLIDSNEILIEYWGYGGYKRRAKITQDSIYFYEISKHFDIYNLDSLRIIKIKRNKLKSIFNKLLIESGNFFKTDSLKYFTRIKLECPWVNDGYEITFVNDKRILICSNCDVGLEKKVKICQPKNNDEKAFIIFFDELERMIEKIKLDKLK